MGISDAEKLNTEDYIESDKEWKDSVAGALWDIESSISEVSGRIIDVERHLSHIAQLTEMSKTINDTYVRFETQINTFAQLRNTILEHIRDKRMAGIEAMERNNTTVISCIKSSLESILQEGCDHNTRQRLEKINYLLQDIQPVPLEEE